MKKIFPSLLLLLLAATFNAHAQNVLISGEGLNTTTITRATFADMRQVVVMAKAQDEKVHRYSGVSLANILNKAGLAPDDSTHRKMVNTYVVITAADGSKAMYTLAEIDPLFANRSIILADREDKKPLSAEDGPFQIIVPGEKLHARWLRQVSGIQVVQIK
jgi:hypothetical protein